MKFILAGLGNWYPWEWRLTQTAVARADELGFWAVVLPDHYLWTERRGNASLDSWIALTFLAAQSKHIRLGTLVTPIPFRSPAILAKMVSTLDVISNGRVVLGVGSGWLRPEFEAYSKWDVARIRVDKTEEGVKLILKLWKERLVNFQGRYYRAKNAVLEPKPVQKPRPPLLFGGEGPRMLRMAGRYADICFIAPWIGLDFADTLRLVLKEARSVGRGNKISFAAGAPSVQPPYLGSRYQAEQYVKRAEQAREEGCEYLVVPFPRATYLDSMEDFARTVLPSFASER